MAANGSCQFDGGANALDTMTTLVLPAPPCVPVYVCVCVCIRDSGYSSSEMVVLMAVFVRSKTVYRMEEY